MNRATAHRGSLRRSLRHPRLAADSFLPPSGSAAKALWETPTSATVSTAPSTAAAAAAAPSSIAVGAGSTGPLREVQDLGSTCADEELAPLCLIAFSALAVLHARSAAVALLSAAATEIDSINHGHDTSSSNGGSNSISAARFASLVAAVKPSEETKTADSDIVAGEPPVADTEPPQPPLPLVLPPKPALWRLWRLELFRSSPLACHTAAGVGALVAGAASSASSAGAKSTCGLATAGLLTAAQHLEATLVGGGSFSASFDSSADNENGDVEAGNSGCGKSAGRSSQGAAETVLRALISGAVDRCVAVALPPSSSSASHGPTPPSPSNAAASTTATAANATELAAQVKVIAAMVKQTIHDSVAELELAAQPALRRVPWAPSTGRLALHLSEHDALNQPNPELSAWLLSTLARLAMVHSPPLRAAASTLRSRRRARTHANSSGLMSARARRSRSVTSPASTSAATANATATAANAAATSDTSTRDNGASAPAGSATSVPLSAREPTSASFDNTFNENDVIEDAAWDLTKALDQALSPFMLARLGRLAARAPSLPLRRLAMELAGLVLNTASLRIAAAAASAAAGINNHSKRAAGPASKADSGAASGTNATVTASIDSTSAAATRGPVVSPEASSSSSALVSTPRAPVPPRWLLLHAGAAPYRQRGTERELLASLAARLRKDAAAASFLNWAASPMLYAPDEPAVLGVASLLAQWHSLAAAPSTAQLAEEVWDPAVSAASYAVARDPLDKVRSKEGATVKLPAVRLVDLSSSHVSLAWEEDAGAKDVTNGGTSGSDSGTEATAADARVNSAVGGKSPGGASAATNETSFDESDERSVQEGGHFGVGTHQGGRLDDVNLGDSSHDGRSLGAPGLLGLFEEDLGSDLGLVSSPSSAYNPRAKAESGVENRVSDEDPGRTLVLEYRLKLRCPGTGLGDGSSSVINSRSSTSGRSNEAELEDIEDVEAFDEDSGGAENMNAENSGHKNASSGAGGWVVAADGLPRHGAGTFSLDGLAPDTAYEFRLVESWQHLLTEAAAAAENCGSTADELEVERAVRHKAKLIRQRNARQQLPLSVTTSPEPPFMLDANAKGPNLRVSQSGRTVANGVNKQWNAVRASTGWCEGIHRWEVSF